MRRSTEEIDGLRLPTLAEMSQVLAQILDRGDLDDWRELYQLAARDETLRTRILRLCTTVPMAMPHLFIAAMGATGRARGALSPRQY